MFGIVDSEGRYSFVNTCGLENEGWVSALPPNFKGIKGAILEEEG